MNVLAATWLDGSHVNLPIAFAAGVVTFFASCLLPLVPTYLAYLSGVSLSSAQASISTEQRWRVIKAATLFTVGFVVSFVMIGLAFHALAAPFVGYRWWFERVTGIIFILLGAHLLGWLNLAWLNQERRFEVPSWFKRHRSWQALITGLAFGSSWSPCVGPVLAVVLFWSARQETALAGTGLLIVYGLGLGLPFLVIGALFESLVPWLKQHAKLAHWASLLSGIIIMLSGAMMLLGQFGTWSGLMLHWLS